MHTLTRQRRRESIVITTRETGRSSRAADARIEGAIHAASRSDCVDRKPLHRKMALEREGKLHHFAYPEKFEQWLEQGAPEVTLEELQRLDKES
jgi:hypothetical protein